MAGCARHQSQSGAVLLKMDVNEHETEILRGARNTLKSTLCPSSKAPCRICTDGALAEKARMILWDILDPSYFHGNLYQVDLIFAAAQFVTHPSLLDPHVLMGMPEIDQAQWFHHHGPDDL